MTHLEKQGYQTQWNKEIEKVKHLNQAKQGYRRHINSYKQVGSDTKQPAYVVESIRADIADTYYDIMYGDGTIDSYERENPER